MLQECLCFTAGTGEQEMQALGKEAEGQSGIRGSKVHDLFGAPEKQPQVLGHLAVHPCGNCSGQGTDLLACSNSIHSSSALYFAIFKWIFTLVHYFRLSLALSTHQAGPSLKPLLTYI